MRKKSAAKSNDLLAELAPKEVHSPESIVQSPEAMPRVLEYRPVSSTDHWRVELFELFQAEFALTPPFDKAMAMFHEVGEQYSRGWLIAKMLFGITPMILPDNVEAADMEARPREVICDKLGIEKGQLQAELDALRTLWGSAVATQAEAPTPTAPREELAFDDNIFKALGFSDSIFEVERRDVNTKESIPRPLEEKKIERAWFIRRVTDWSKMLEEPMAGSLVRQTLMNELYLRRLETEISRVMPGSDAFTKLQKTKNEMEITYQSQLEQLKTMFPEMNTAGKTSFRACISDFKDAYIEYKSHGSTRLIDRIRTAAEIDIECRQSLQKPEPQYRFGLNTSWVEAVHGLYDPNWKSGIPMRVWKKMDAAGKAAINAARETMGEPMVDLEKGVSPDEGSQFPDLEEVV